MAVAISAPQEEEEIRMRRVARAVLGLLVAATALMPAWATTAVERTDTDLIQEAAIIVTGHCTRLQSQWLPPRPFPPPAEPMARPHPGDDRHHLGHRSAEGPSGVRGDGGPAGRDRQPSP